MVTFDRSDGTLIVRFEPEEASILRDLLDQLERLLGAEPTGDPISSRLFPDAYAAEEDQRAFDELVGKQLRDEKLRVVREAREALATGDVTIDQGSLHSWLVVLTDLRLAIGTRLEVTEEVMARELDPEDPDAPALSLLHWLGWVQESMLSQMN